MKRILFDETHGEILTHRNATELRVLLNSLSEITVVEPNGRTIESGLLEQYDIDILVIAAPADTFSPREIDAIKTFLRSGNSLLFASNHKSLDNKAEVPDQINGILENFDVHVQQVVGRRDTSIQNFFPHYLSSGVERLIIENPTRIKILGSKPLVVATSSMSNEPFLVAIEAGSSRVIVVGDTSFLKDGNIKQGDNQILALNIFRWLSLQNIVDIHNVSIDSEIRYGKRGRFSAGLSNLCIQERLDGIQCLLESSEVSIDKPRVSIRSIAIGDTRDESWQIEPQKLGFHSLSLNVELPGKWDNNSFRIDPAAQFQCVPDADIRLIVSDQKGDIQDVVETGVSFNVSVSVRWEAGAKQTPLHFRLERSSSLVVEQLTEHCWRLTALDEGKQVLIVKVQETSQIISKLIYAEPSLVDKINKIEREIVSEIEAKIKYRLSQILPTLNISVLQSISFNLLTPEDFISKVYPAHIQERLMDILHIIKQKGKADGGLIKHLLYYVAPLYSPTHGCCIPYAPELAAHLIEEYTLHEQNIAYSFLWIGDGDVYGRTWLEGNIAALLLHEKYGHGFFYTQTKLGQQLSILYRHGLLTKVSNENLKIPYLRAVHDEYGQAIRMLFHSAIILNEGLATWVEMTGLQHLGGVFTETVYRRKNFLFQDTELEELYPRSEYFNTFDPRPGSKYEIGYMRLESIQNDFGVKLGLGSVLDSVVRAADVDFGISEQDGRVQFALRESQIRQLLLENRRGYEAGAQRRIAVIQRVIKAYFRQLKGIPGNAKQLEVLQAVSSVDKILEKKLGW